METCTAHSLHLSPDAKLAHGASAHTHPKTDFTFWGPFLPPPYYVPLPSSWTQLDHL